MAILVQIDLSCSPQEEPEVLVHVPTHKRLHEHRPLAMLCVIAALGYGRWRVDELDREFMYSSIILVFYLLVLASFVAYVNTPMARPTPD